MKTAIHKWYHSDNALSKLARISYRKVALPVCKPIRQRILEKRTTQEIAEVAEILYRHECVWSLQTGNVLGIFRDGGYLKNEADIDMAVLAERDGIWDSVVYRWYGGVYPHRYYFVPELLEETRSVDLNGFRLFMPTFAATSDVT